MAQRNSWLLALVVVTVPLLFRPIDGAADDGADVKVLGWSFVVSVLDLDSGQWISHPGSVVPMLPNRSCYEWRLRVGTIATSVGVEETFILPAVPRKWPDDPGIELRDQRRVAITRLDLTVDDGWIAHGWCVVPGDPTGVHRIDVRYGTELLHRFCFVVRDGPERGDRHRTAEPRGCEDAVAARYLDPRGWHPA